jgi:lysozyme family protein
MLTFDQAFDRLFTSEGGYSNDPRDPGGETNWGISKRAYPTVEIRTLTREEAKAIYLRDFWARIGADSLPSSVVYQVFDFAVNSGIETAVRYLQRAIGAADDGHWGPVSSAIAASLTAPAMILMLNAERLELMTKLSNWPTASRGWARRIARNLQYAEHDLL